MLVCPLETKTRKRNLDRNLCESKAESIVASHHHLLCTISQTSDSQSQTSNNENQDPRKKIMNMLVSNLIYLIKFI